MTNKHLDFSDHANRILRGQELGAQLGGEIQAWASSKPWDTEARIAENRLSWTLTLRVSQPPPLAQWGLLFGEAVHHLRASLDNMAVSIARQTGVSNPQDLKRIQFPISGTEADWKKDKSRIKALPAHFAVAIEAVQPFQQERRGGSSTNDLLLLLRDLDNQDKHYLQIKPLIQKAAELHSHAVEFESEADAAASIPPDTEVFDASFEDNQLLLRHRTKGRIAKIKGDYKVSAQVQVLLPGGRQAGLTKILALLCHNTDGVMGYVASQAATRAQPSGSTTD